MKSIIEKTRVSHLYVGMLLTLVSFILISTPILIYFSNHPYTYMSIVVTIHNYNLVLFTPIINAIFCMSAIVAVRRKNPATNTLYPEVKRSGVFIVGILLILLSVSTIFIGDYIDNSISAPTENSVEMNIPRPLPNNKTGSF